VSARDADALAIGSARSARFGFRMARRISNSKHEWVERSGLLVRLESQGIVGVGEASPLPGYSTESLEQAEVDVARALSALRPMPREGSALDALRTSMADVEELVPSARFALETALLDLRARARGAPLWRDLLGVEATTPEAIPIGTLLVGADADAVVADARAALARGVTCGKLKVGRDLDAEVAVVAALRRELGDSFAVRLDANGAWSAAEAQRALAAFAPFRPELVEEPVADDVWASLTVGGSAPDTGALRAARSASLERQPVPLAMDETCCHPGGLELLDDALRRGVCAVVVLKLPTVGGFLAASSLVARARAAGASVLVTHMFDGPVATAAAAHFVLSLGRSTPSAALGADPPPGLDVRAYLDAIPDGHPIGVSHVRPREGHGLGTPDSAIAHLPPAR
jgi:o-succinylbenzoate synthase